jgi:hypothetical protein
MPANLPIVMGKAAIEKVIRADFEKRKPGLVTAYETTDVFGDDKIVSEFGKTTTKMPQERGLTQASTWHFGKSATANGWSSKICTTMM